jgi:hypothetical protein
LKEVQVEIKSEMKGWKKNVVQRKQSGVESSLGEGREEVCGMVLFLRFASVDVAICFSLLV